MTGAELAARAGVAEDSAVVDRLVEIGLVERSRGLVRRAHHHILLIVTQP